MKLIFADNQKGIVALMAILLIVAVILTTGISLGMRSIGEMKMGLQKSQSLQADYLANLCAEQALMKLRENSGYAGNETITAENGQCTIYPIEGSWVAKVSATSSRETRKIKIGISQLNPKITVDYWQEVADF